MSVSPELVKRILDDRPFKLNEEEVNYQDGNAEDYKYCHNCIHFFGRVMDGFHTCEIFRPSGEEESVNPDYVCDFWDGPEEV